MKVKTILFSIVSLLLFSACSSSRYGYMPKGKRQKSSTKKETRKWRKHPKQTESISIQQEQLPTVSINKTSASRIELPKLKQSKQKRSKVRELKNENRKVKSENASDTPKPNKKTAHQNQQKTQSSDFWEDLWDDFLSELIGAILLLALSIFFIWLESIGLGWVVVLITIVLLVLIIIWVGQVIEDIWDMVFPSY
jgi:preprotein translocase subunit SecF